jgi:hypothetical protein
MQRVLFVMLFLFQMVCSAQTEELHFLKAKVICKEIDLQTIEIKNTRSGTVLYPEKNGDFNMFVKVGDKLIFSGVGIDEKVIEISKNEISKKILTIIVHAKVIQLNEVTVYNYSHINAVSLGILQKPAKQYTPAERRLRTAETFKWYSPLLIPFGGMSVDGLINAISGRTAMLKKELEVERKELFMEKILDNYERNFFTDKLNIPAEYISAFLYYIADNIELKKAVSSNDKLKSEFLFSKLASEYLQVIKQ